MGFVKLTKSPFFWRMTVANPDWSPAVPLRKIAGANVWMCAVNGLLTPPGFLTTRGTSPVSPKGSCARISVGETRNSGSAIRSEERRVGKEYGTQVALAE